MSESSDGKRKMSIAVNWSQMIGAIAGPMQPGDTRESWLSRAARRAGISYRQAKALRYGEVTDPKFSVANSVLSAADRARIEEARRDALYVANLCHQHAETLARVDENSHRPEIDALVETARILGGRDSA